MSEEESLHEVAVLVVPGVQDLVWLKSQEKDVGGEEEMGVSSRCPLYTNTQSSCLGPYTV